MPKVIGFLHRSCPPLTHCTDPWNWRVGRRRGLLGFLGAIDPAFAFAQAVDPYTWRYRPTDPMYRAYGWGGHMTVGMPANYTHHIDYVREPVFGLGQILEALFPKRRRVVRRRFVRRQLLGSYLGESNVPESNVPPASNVPPNVHPNAYPNVPPNVPPNRAPAPPAPPAGPWPSAPGETYVPGPLPLVRRVTAAAPGMRVSAAAPGTQAMAMHPSAVTVAPVIAHAMGPMRASGAAAVASAMGPAVRGAPASQYAGTIRQTKPLPPPKRLAPVIMADRLPMAGLNGCLCGGTCMVGGRRHPLHRCQRPSLPMQMLGAILAVL